MFFNINIFRIIDLHMSHELAVIKGLADVRDFLPSICRIINWNG